MKKQIFKLLIIGIATASFLSSCNKNDVSQEDVITNQQVIDLALRIVDASTSNAPIDSAVVEIVDGSETKTATTDETGMVYFKDITISNSTPVTVRKTNYTSVASEVYTIPDDYRQVQVTETIKLYPTTGDNLATITGKLTIETDVTNREREAVPVGSIVRAFNNSISTTTSFIDSTDADGNYEIKVPVGYNGNETVVMVYPEIYTNQKVAVEGDNYTIEVVDRPTYFRLADNAKSGAIPALPSVYAEIPAPASATIGSGFALASKVNSIALSTASNALLISGGSGYTDGNNQFINLSDGVNGNAAQLQVDVVNGSIVNIDGFVDNGALYTSSPTINTNTLGGSGAEIEIQFQTSYNVYITNNGSGYIDFPTLYIKYYDYLGGILSEVTNSYTLSSYTNLSGGKIVNDNFNSVDTIFTLGSIAATAPEITLVNPSTDPMYISFDVNDINTNGHITSYNTEETGYGYDVANPPAITLHTLAGYGSGAVLNMELTSAGALKNVNIINQGSGYVKNVNDFSDKGITSDYQENPSFSYSYYYDGFRYIYNVKPGSVVIRSANYGTGTPDDNF